VDVSNLPGIVTAADFTFRVGRDNNPMTWTAAPPPVSVILTPLPGHTTRVTVTWPESAIENEWLQVTLKANPNTGLAMDDVFYFGNLAGDAAGIGRVDFASLLALAQQYGKPTAQTTADFNGDGKIDFKDLLLLAQDYGQSLPFISTPPTQTTATAARTSSAQPQLLIDSAARRLKRSNKVSVK
jgi:hypothetical protein